MFKFQSISDYHQQLQNNAITCVDAVQYFLERIESSKHLNIYIEVFAEEAIEAAKRVDEKIKAKEPLSTLDGVVVGLKDVLAYKGHRLSAASKILEGYQSPFHATAVRHLLDHGAIIIGRQNCDEFAMGSSNENSAYGPTLHPKNPTLVPGGSSGGSAAAVAADTCMIALGSDTGGSVRQPADFCGVIGMKPSYGRISRYGLIAYASSFDQIGILGHHLEDVKRVYQILQGKDPLDSTSIDASTIPSSFHPIGAQKKIAYFKEAIENQSLDSEIKAAFLSFTKKLTEQGYEVEAIDFELLKYTVPTYYVLTTAEASSNLSRYDGIKYGKAPDSKLSLDEFYKAARSEGFGKEVKRRILLGSFVLSAEYYDAYFTKAQQVRQLLLQQTQSIFHSYQAIISPTVPTTAFPLGSKTTDPIELFLADIYTVYANLVGIPAISLPLFTHSNGCPFGLQVMTSRYQEVSLLSLSEAFLTIARK